MHSTEPCVVHSLFQLSRRFSSASHALLTVHSLRFLTVCERTDVYVFPVPTTSLRRACLVVFFLFTQPFLILFYSQQTSRSLCVLPLRENRFSFCLTRCRDTLQIVSSSSAHVIFLPLFDDFFSLGLQFLTSSRNRFSFGSTFTLFAAFALFLCCRVLIHYCLCRIIFFKEDHTIQIL